MECGRVHQSTELMFIHSFTQTDTYHPPPESDSPRIESIPSKKSCKFTPSLSAHFHLVSADIYLVLLLRTIAYNLEAKNQQSFIIHWPLRFWDYHLRSNFDTMATLYVFS